MPSIQVKENAYACLCSNECNWGRVRKSINIPPAQMTGIVVIYKSHPAEWAEYCVTIPNNLTDARNDPKPLSSSSTMEKIERDFNYKQNNSCLQDKVETVAS